MDGVKYLIMGKLAQALNRSHYQAMQYIACCGGEADVLMERLVGGSYGYTVNGRFRTKKWINANCTNVLGYIFND